MPSFGTVALPDINPLYDLASIDRNVNAINAGRLANEGATQTLADRATLRGLAPGLAANDPAATATALTLPGVGGDAAASGLANMHADQRAALGQTLSVTGQISGAVLAAPPDQRAALWKQLQPLMVQAGAVKTPAEYPGDDVVAAHRTAALSTQEQIAALGNAFTGDPYRTPLSPPSGVRIGPGGVVQGQTAAGDFTPQMAASESPGGPGVVNKGGYSGQFQFGAGRLADPNVGVYTPAQGEDLNANTWQGTFHIPGFPDVKTHADFLASPDAQRAVFASHVADIDSAIAQTPGASGLNQNGLRAVAHLGGVAGMRRFVSSGGLYDPADANGTKLSDYYSRFSQGGPRALQQAFGHPDGPPAPSGPVQVAGPGAPTAASPQPGTQGADDVLARLRAAQGVDPSAISGPGPSLPPQTAAAIPNQNALLPLAQTDTSAPINQLMPAASAVPPAATSGGVQQTPSGLQPGETPLYVPGKGPAPASIPGYQLTRRADGSYGMVRMPGAPPKIKTETVGGQMINIDENTGQEVGSRIAVPDARRALQSDENGMHVVRNADGQVLSSTPTGAYKVATLAYDRDAKEIAGIADAGHSAQSDNIRIQAMRDALANLPTGSGGTTRAAMASFVQTYLPDQAAGFIKSIADLPDAAVAQEFSKLALKGAGTQERQVLGARGGYQAMRLFQATNPGLDLLPGANRAILGMQLIGNQADADYSQGAQAWFTQNEDRLGSEGKYASLAHYDQQWQGERQPQIYAAAMGALAGLPVESGSIDGKSVKGWATGLSDKEYQRALNIVSRADPSAKVNGKSGPLSMQPPNGSGTPPIPAVGTIMQGHRFLGGNPASPTSWQPVQ